MTEPFGPGSRPELAWRFADLRRIGGWRFRIGLPTPRAAALMLFGATLPVWLTLHFLGNDTTVWMTDGVVLAILLRTRPAGWPVLFLIFSAGEFAMLRLSGQGFREAFFGTLSDVFDLAPACVILHSVEQSAPLFSSVRQIWNFTAVNLVTALSGALVGCVLLFLDGYPLIASFVTWYLSLVFAQLIVTPFVLMWRDTVAAEGLQFKWNVAIPVLLVGFTSVVDFATSIFPGAYLTFPFLLLAAFRGGVLAAISAAFLVTIVASTTTLLGVGPFAAAPGSTFAAQLLDIQLYLGVILLSSLPVAVMLEQRKLLSAEKTLRELSHMARHDALTGLPNRLSFEENLRRTLRGVGLRGAGDAGMQTALLMLDLDRFKPVNDLYGHAAGDKLLQAVSLRIRGAIRDADIAARLGGDEFAVIAQLADKEVANLLAARIIAALRQPFDLDGLSVEIGCSIGIALNTEAGLENEEMMQRADAALYRAKTAGRNCSRFFEAGMEKEIRDRAQLEAELRQAIALGQLFPHYQPIVRLGSADVVGFELLARWSHASLGDIPPSEFIPIAEQASLMAELTELLVRRACLAALGWPDPIYVSINISPIQLRDRRLPRLFRAILAETGLPPHRLEVELTESALIDDFALARAILTELKEIGIKLALDDFGTGYSSLAHLQSLPLDKLKIDRSFVGTMDSVPASRTIVASVLGLSHSLGLDVVAEGLETQAIADSLHAMGCDFGQGWLYGRGMTAEAVTAMLGDGVRGEVVGVWVLM